MYVRLMLVSVFFFQKMCPHQNQGCVCSESCEQKVSKIWYFSQCVRLTFMLYFLVINKVVIIIIIIIFGISDGTVAVQIDYYAKVYFPVVKHVDQRNKALMRNSHLNLLCFCRRDHIREEQSLRICQGHPNIVRLQEVFQDDVSALI